MMIYAGDIYQDENGDTVMSNNGKICAPIKSSYIGDGVHITNRIEPERPYSGTRLLSSADAQGKQIGFGFRITTLEDGNDFWGQGVGRDFTFYLESIAISKPGTQLDTRDSYDIMCGTSMACPAVCGASALIAALCPKQGSQTPAQYTQSLREKLFSCVRRNDALADLCSTGGYLDLSLLDAGIPAITNAVCDVDNETITLCGANLFDGTKLTCRSLSTAGASATALPDGMTTECSDDGRSMVIRNAKALFSTYTELIATSADGKVGTGKFFLVKGQPKLELISNLNPDTDKDPQPSLITDASGSALFGYDSSTGRIAKFDGKYLYYLPNTDLSAALTEYLPKTGVSKYHVLNNYEFSVFSSLTPITDGDLVYGFITATDNKTDELSHWIGVLDMSNEDLHWEFRPCGAFPDDINYLTGSKPYAAAYKGRIYFFSGLDVSAPHTKAFSLDLSTLAWNTEPAPPCDVTHPTITVYDGKLYYMMGAVVDHEKSGEERLANDVYCFDGTSWVKVGTIPFIGRYSFDNVAIYHMESVAKAKNGIVFVNTSVDGGGNIFLYNTKTNTCEPLYYTTDDTIVDCYNEQSSCVATEDGIYFARKSGYGINENYELYLLPSNSGAYESLYSGSALLGDVDGDGSVTVADATCIRRMLASIPLPFEFDENVADVDRDGEVTIIDVTMIQRWLVELPAADGIGKPIG